MESLREAAKKLVIAHRDAEPNLQQAFVYDDPTGQEVRLLEVVEESPEADEVLPFRFAANPSHGTMFPVVIIELSPEEFERVRDGREPQWHLPSGWIHAEPLYP